jgi:hypothetical protein
LRHSLGKPNSGNNNQQDNAYEKIGKSNTSNGTTSGPVVSISGLTVSNGKASGSAPANFGGGIFNDRGTLTIANCSVTGNTADYGSGVNNSGSATAPP